MTSRLRVLDDDDVRRLLDAPTAVAAARTALLDSYGGRLAAPPRAVAEIGDNGLAFTAGGYPGGLVGVRIYGFWPGESDQVVLAWNGVGRLEGCVVGSEVGVRRTGALGAVAADALARLDAARVAVIGSGAQAWAQLWAIASVRELSSVLVFSPTHGNRQEFALRAERELGLRARAVDAPSAALIDADIVILATRSATPVVDASWIPDGAHVNTVGPKTRSAHETPPALADTAAVVVSDSPAQASAYGEPFFTSRPLVHLGGLLAGDELGRQLDSDITLYCSTGLAGSEVIVADALLRAAAI